MARQRSRGPRRSGWRSAGSASRHPASIRSAIRRDARRARRELDLPESLWADSCRAGLRPAKEPVWRALHIFESLITYLGKDPKTGFVRRPLGNVGIQYGLKALADGRITPDQFIELNARIGGFDADGTFIAQRTVSDREGIANAYRSGRVFTGKGMSLPILDLRTYQDQLGNVHTRFHTFETRQRLMDANGTVANQILWTWAPTAPAADTTARRSMPWTSGSRTC